MKKRVLSLLLCTAMTIGALSGCGKDAGKDEGKTTEVLGNDAGDEMTEVKIWHDGDENIMQIVRMRNWQRIISRLPLKRRVV